MKAPPFTSTTGREAAVKSNSTRDKGRWSPDYYREIARRGGLASRGKPKRRRKDLPVPTVAASPPSRDLLAVVEEMESTSAP
jgi:hypothetical protein